MWDLARQAHLPPPFANTPVKRRPTIAAASHKRSCDVDRRALTKSGDRPLAFTAHSHHSFQDSDPGAVESMAEVAKAVHDGAADLGLVEGRVDADDLVHRLNVVLELPSNEAVRM